MTEEHAGSEVVRLLAGNGEYVRPDDETGELVARHSPGREWDTWRLTEVGGSEAEQLSDGERFVQLTSTVGHSISDTGDGDLRLSRAFGRSSERFTLVPLNGSSDHGSHGSEHHGSEQVPAFETFAPAVALRSPSGQYVGFEPGSDRLVARAAVPDWDSAFVIERTEAEPAVALDSGRVIVTTTPLTVTGVHSVVLPGGDVLVFAYSSAARENNLESGVCERWNPASGPVAGSRRAIPRNLFCSGHCWLGDGRLLVAGGQSNNFPVPGSPLPGVWGADHDIHTYNATSHAWTRHANMPSARYYPTCTTLANGNAFIASGAAVRGLGGNVPNDEYEIFDFRTNAVGPKRRFRPLGTDFLHHAEYPFIHLLHDGSPQGLLFVFAWKEARLFDVAAGAFRGESFKAANEPRTYPHQGASVLLPLRVDAPRKAKVLVLGGSRGEGHADPATNSVQIFDFNADNPAASRWRAPKGGGMRSNRFMSDAVLLPDETVFVVNGAGRGSADSSFDPVYGAELFDTRSETWSAGARINRPRLYHSTAVLLPDARVMITGNTQTFNPGNPTEDRTVELYSPPYLFRGPRPEVTSAPATVAFGDEFRIATPTPDAISGVSLLRACSVTHTNDMDQRHLILPIVRREPGGVIVGAPPSGTIAPPGPYLVFLLNAARVPSVGRFVQLREGVRGARFVDQSVPNEVRTGETFAVTVTMQNSGTLRWARSRNYRLGSQGPQDNTVWGTSRVDLPADAEPGATTSFAFTVTAPAQQGSFPFQWRMLQEQVEWFGPATPAVRIVVRGDDEPPECATIRAALAEINAQVVELQDRLEGNPKLDAPIIRAINRLKARARQLTADAQAKGCVVPMAGHH